MIVNNARFVKGYFEEFEGCRSKCEAGQTGAWEGPKNQYTWKFSVGRWKLEIVLAKHVQARRMFNVERRMMNVEVRKRRPTHLPEFRDWLGFSVSVKM